ncbi:histone deacetylase 9-like isoform X3 [Mobula hypostoma]|uniref:histone deacetylase 9-like isoform X3 n=1 Tax=Mobula hypostoma TaxID=723540 RepID=UPI002FC3931B
MSSSIRPVILERKQADYNAEVPIKKHFPHARRFINLSRGFDPFATTLPSYQHWGHDGVSEQEQPFQLLASQRMHNMLTSVEVSSPLPLALQSTTPVDLRSDLRIAMPVVDAAARKTQLQQELLLLQHQHQLQKQLLFAEFQKQHETLTRQHQVQLQEHLKQQQELLAIQHQQEIVEQERKLEKQRQQQELGRQLHEQHLLSLRSKERGRESAMASTEVKQKLQEFLLSKSAKETSMSGQSHSVSQHPKLWYLGAHHASLDQSSSPQSITSPSYKRLLPEIQSMKDDFPLRKTDSSVCSSAPGSGPSSPNSNSSSMSVENGLSNSPAEVSTASQNSDRHTIQGTALTGQFRRSTPLSAFSPPAPFDGKVNSSHQVLLQHVFLMEQARKQGPLTGGVVPLHAHSSLRVAGEKLSPTLRSANKLPRHRPLNRTYSAPLPQNTQALAQLVARQQHQQLSEKQRQYPQQTLSKSHVQLQQRERHPEETEEECSQRQVIQEDEGPPCGSSRSNSNSVYQRAATYTAQVKMEPSDNSDKIHLKQNNPVEQSTVFHQLLDHQRVHQLGTYQTQMAMVGMTGSEKHRPVSRTQSSPASSTLPYPSMDHPIRRVHSTGIFKYQHSYTNAAFPIGNHNMILGFGLG